ncbi:hypothetical protein P3342_008704 [Pyrenophora teres f. teres]|nr:hypothetical protein P3342_008704 [Pyrenophora teres f. teres]
MLFPKPPNYIPDTFLEVRNWIAYASLPSLVQHGKSIHDTPGMPQALSALESQRKRDLEDWMDKLGLDILAFPSQGDVGLADLESDVQSAGHSLQNGVKYSNGNRAVRHLGVPTVTVSMGVGEETGMPVGLTFAGRGYGDEGVLGCAWAFENAMGGRVVPGRVPALRTDHVETVQGVGKLLRNVTAHLTSGLSASDHDVKVEMQVQGSLHSPSPRSSIQVFADGEEVYNQAIDGQDFTITFQHKLERPEVLGWDLKPLPAKDVMVIVIATGSGPADGKTATREARLLWVPIHKG